MRRQKVAAGITALALLLLGCSAGNTEERENADAMPETQVVAEKSAALLEKMLSIPGDNISVFREDDPEKYSFFIPEAGTAEPAEEPDDAETAQETPDTPNTEEEPAAPVEKTVSILGDSISTFRDYNPEGYSVFFPEFGAVKAVEETWWQRVIGDLGLTLYQNGSSSGSTAAGDSTGTEDPACACNELRTGALYGPQGACPESIIIYLGTNDLMNHVPPGENDGTTPVAEGVAADFSDAYTLILDKLQAKYPAAKLYCCTLLPVGDYGTDTPYVDFVNELGLTAADYSGMIRRIAENKGLCVIDLQDCGITVDNLAEMTIDGVHPTPAGMACIAAAVEEALAARR